MNGPQTKITLEVCIASVDDAVSAVSGGADRLELNMGIELGGLTPSVGLMTAVKQAVDVPVLAMVRPRAAGFRYSPVDLRLMLKDAESLLALGADGIVAGALTEDGLIPIDFWSELRNIARGRELVFHRAIDATTDPSSVIEQLIELGTDRVLTSGGAASAWKGRDKISQLRELAANRIQILPGCGITPKNAVEVLKSTGCRQLHGTFREWREDTAGIVCDGRYPATSQRLVAEVRAQLDAISVSPTD